MNQWDKKKILIYVRQFTTSNTLSLTHGISPRIITYQGKKI